MQSLYVSLIKLLEPNTVLDYNFVSPPFCMRQMKNFTQYVVKITVQLMLDTNIITTDSIDYIITLSVSYLRNHVADAIRLESALLLTKIDQPN